MRSRAHFALIAVALVACSGDDGPPADLDYQLEGQHAARVAGFAADTLSSMKALSQAFIDEDPTVDPARSAGENADAIAARIKAATASTCAGATVTHDAGSPSVTVTFPSTGCTLSGVAVAGTVVVKVDGGAGTPVQVTLQLKALSVDGTTLNGYVMETTSDGTSYKSSVIVTSDALQVSYDGAATLDAGAKGVTLSGGGKVKELDSSQVTQVTLSAVHKTFGACWLDGGSLTLTKSSTLTAGNKTKPVSITKTVSFDAKTPTSGMATVTVLSTTKPFPLPSYGSCQAAAPAGDAGITPKDAGPGPG